MKEIKTAQLQNLSGEALEKENSVSSSEIDESGKKKEAELIQIAKNDPAAFDILYQHYVLRVYHYFLLRSFDKEDAADLTQHVFVLVLGALPRYQERNLAFAAWIFRIARNVATDAYRRDRKNIALELLPQTPHPCEWQDPEILILQQEKCEQLRELLTKLSNEKRELLVFRFAVGLSVNEIASVMGKSEAAIRKQLSRTLANLKNQFEEQYQ